MAVAFQGFSIREYAAKMRTVDLGKCWPFGIDPSDEMKKEDIKLLLPPITVTKFRWWSHELHGGRKHDQIHGGNANVRGEEVELRINGSELDAERAEFKKSQAEDEKLEMVCPVCLIFTAATVNAVNAHMDSCLAQPSKKDARRQMKAKTSKAPKKRSIAEIFAVAPQIEAVNVDDESGDEDSSGGGEMFGSCKFSSRDNVVSIIKGKKNINKRMKLKKKKKKKKRALEESGMAIVSKLKKNKKFKKAAVKNGSIAKKVPKWREVVWVLWIFGCKWWFSLLLMMIGMRWLVVGKWCLGKREVELCFLQGHCLQHEWHMRTWRDRVGVASDQPQFAPLGEYLEE